MLSFKRFLKESYLILENKRQDFINRFLKIHSDHPLVQQNPEQAESLIAHSMSFGQNADEHRFLTRQLLDGTYKPGEDNPTIHMTLGKWRRGKQQGLVKGSLQNHNHNSVSALFRDIPQLSKFSGKAVRAGEELTKYHIGQIEHPKHGTLDVYHVHRSDIPVEGDKEEDEYKKPNVLLIGQSGMLKDIWELKSSHLAPLKEIANVDLVLVDSMTETELAEKCLGYDYLMLNMDFLPAYPDKMDKLTSKFYNHPNIRGLKGINVDMTDADFFSPKLAKQKGILLQTSPNAVTRSVAESAVTEILLHARQRHLAYQDEISGKDVQCRKATDLFRKNAGIIGFGNIGKAVGEMLSGMGMNVFYNDIDKMKPGKMISLEEMFKKCDVITIHVPAIQKKSNISNIGMIDSKLLNLCKGTVLINLATDIIVDADDLLKAIDSGKITGYSVEPGRKITNKLKRKKEVHISPCSFDSTESRRNVLNIWIGNMISAIQGSPNNLWN